MFISNEKYTLPYKRRDKLLIFFRSFFTVFAMKQIKKRYMPLKFLYKGIIIMENSTIAAIATANGPGGIGVIRISGEQAFEIADKVFVSIKNKKLSHMQGYTAAFGYVYDNDEKIDEVIATVFKSPHSYTGENVVELSCHGGMYVTKMVLRTVINAGARIAEAGEFTKRAFLNGKMDLTEAEAVMDIIGAKGKSSARAALSQKDGSLSNAINKCKYMIVDMAAHLSAWADYPEEDIPEISSESLYANINEVITILNNLLDNYDAGMAIKSGVDTIIAGSPNVGKSTLMNLLSGSQKSIVTDIPGTTRDIIEETVVLNDIILNLSDTAGIRDTDNPVEKIGVDMAKSRLQSCGLILAVFDGSSPLTYNDKQLIETVKDMPVIAVINKTDIESKIETSYIEQRIDNIVYISASKGTGVEDLSKAVAKITGTENYDPSAASLATERQRDCTVRALSALKEALESLNIGITLDAVTVSLEEAVQNLLELTGERAGEVVVQNVFSKFCVGK